MEKKLIDYEGFEAYAQRVRDKYAEKKDIITDDERRYIKLVNEGYTLTPFGDLEVLFGSLLTLICDNPSMAVASLLDFIKQWAYENDFDEKKVVNSERYKKYGLVGAWQQEQSKNESLLVRHVDGHVLSVEEISSLLKQETDIIYIWALKPLIEELNAKYATVNTLQFGELKFVEKDGSKQLSANDYTNEDKAKVDAIPNNPKYTDTIQDLSGYAKKEILPTKLSQLTNDKTFKTESEIQSMIEKASSLKKEVVTSLPKTGKDDVIYLVKDEKGKDNNNYLEYLWLNGKYELIGSTQVDLSGYVTKEELGKVSNEQQQQRKNISQHEENIQHLQDDMKQTLSKNDVVAMPSPNTTEGVYSAGAVNQIQSDIMQNFETVQQSFGSMVDEKLNELDIQEFTQQELEEAFK